MQSKSAGVAWGLAAARHHSVFIQERWNLLTAEPRRQKHKHCPHITSSSLSNQIKPHRKQTATGSQVFWLNCTTKGELTSLTATFTWFCTSVMLKVSCKNILIFLTEPKSINPLHPTFSTSIRPAKYFSAMFSLYFVLLLFYFSAVQPIWLLLNKHM